MRNSLAISAGVPAPFPNLNPLRGYLQRLELAVVAPDYFTNRSFCTFGKQQFSPVLSVTLTDSGTSYEVVNLGAPLLEKWEVLNTPLRLRVAACQIYPILASRIADAGAFPGQATQRAFELLKSSLERLVGDYGRGLHRETIKRIRLELLNVWRRQSVTQVNRATGVHDQILENVEIGWSVFGAPYLTAGRAKRIARRSPYRQF